MFRLVGRKECEIPVKYQSFGTSELLNCTHKTVMINECQYGFSLLINAWMASYQIVIIMQWYDKTVVSILN